MDLLKAIIAPFRISCPPFLAGHNDEWDRWVSLAVYAYNTSIYESTGFSPYELVFGRKARTALELDLQVPLKNPV